MMANAICLAFALISNLVIQFICASDLPRGANPSNRHIYDPSANFKCLDGSSVITFDKVNDDYCDCMDGSDEPGTAACPHGIFYCHNEGYKPIVLPSSRVGDGVCDCCDGSDEYTGLARCRNDCLVLGEQLRAVEQKTLQLLEDGYEIFKEYSEEGTSAKTERKTRLIELELEQGVLGTEKDRLMALKDEAEIPEQEAKNKHKQLWEESKTERKAEKRRDTAMKAFEEIDANSDGKISIEEMQSRAEFDIDANGEVSHDEAKEYLEDNEAVEFETFREKVWDNVEQIFKKKSATVQTDEEKQTEGVEEDATQTVPPPEEDDERSYADEDDEDEDDDDKSDTKKTQDEDSKSDEFDDEQMPPYDAETQKTIEVADEARSKVNEIESKLKDLQNEIDEARKIIDSDFGKDNEFYHLRDQCYEWSDREYTYKLCPFERTTQKNKNGGSETSLGRWSKWAEGDDKYMTMFYENGQNCWNGPDRSTKVILQCGTTNELMSASEPNRCEYQFVFSTPAACNYTPHTQTTPRVEL